MSAVQYAPPARYSIIRKLRQAFLGNQIVEKEVVDKTCRFLYRAGESRGLERNIVRNLCHVEWSIHHQKAQYVKIKYRLIQALTRTEDCD